MLPLVEELWYRRCILFSSLVTHSIPILGVDNLMLFRYGINLEWYSGWLGILNMYTHKIQINFIAILHYIYINFSKIYKEILLNYVAILHNIYTNIKIK